MPKLTVLKKDDHIVRADPDRQAEVIETCKANGYVIEGEEPEAATEPVTEPAPEDGEPAAEEPPKRGRPKKA